MRETDRCEKCGAALKPDSRFCPECGTTVRRQERSPAWPHVFLAVMLIGTGICFVLGWVAAESAVQQCAWFASGAVLGILARMAQAASQ